MKKKLTSILNSAIAIPLIAGTLLAGNGCSKDPIEILSQNKCEKTVHLLGKETYWNYAKQLRKKYPETIGKLDIRDVWMYLRDYNGGKNLRKGDTIKLPDCYEDISKN